jgi:hypothetical protein
MQLLYDLVVQRLQLCLSLKVPARIRIHAVSTTPNTT